VDLRLFWRALLVQSLVVGLLFAVLLALPLDREFFREWGAVLGPAAWVAASLVTLAALSLSWIRVALAALVSGALGLLAGLAIGHGPGLIVSLLVFAGACATILRRREIAPAR